MAGMRFTKHLSEAVLNGRLVSGLHDTGDWLRLLEADSLNELTQMLEKAFNEPERIDQDLPALLVHLVFFEARRDALSLDELMELMRFLLMMCKLETYVRQGYIKLYGKWRIIEPDDEQHYARLTEKGYRAASEPGATLFLRNLKQKTGGIEWN